MARHSKFLAVFMLILLTCGCAGGQIPLFNYSLDSWWGTPDYVTVRKGDTLYSIARRYDVPIRDIIETNRLRPPYALNIGQTLRMPNTKYHVVAKGDTMYNISKRYNVDMRSLSKINNLDEPYALALGQRLVLPGSVVSAPSSSSYASSPTPQKQPSSWWSSSPKATETYTPPPKKRSSTFAWPVKGTIISRFGPIAKGRNNDGINIKAPLGTSVSAADSGTVAYAGNELKGFGNLILIRHSDGWVTAYAHNDRLLVKKGQKVIKGEKISTVGSTGGVSTPQLHFEIRAGKKALNPMSYLK